MGTITRTIREALKDKFDNFLKTIPNDVMISALSSNKPDDVIGQYVLMESRYIVDYVTAPVWGRKEAALKAIRTYFNEVGLEIPPELNSSRR